MATISSLISDLRVELKDSKSARWSNDDLLTLVKKCVRRTNDILIRYQMRFAESTDTFNTVVGTTTYSLPSDFDIPIALYREDRDERLHHTDDDTWEQITSFSENRLWRINGSNIEVMDSPTVVTGMTFYYYPEIDTSAYTTSTSLPWSGRVDDIIGEYLLVRCGNVDEMDVSFDKMLESEITRGRLKKYEALRPQPDVVEGWLATSRY